MEVIVVAEMEQSAMQVRRKIAIVGGEKPYFLGLYIPSDF